MELGRGGAICSARNIPLSAIPLRGFRLGSPAARSSGLRKSGSCQPQCSQRHGQTHRFTIMEMMQTIQMPHVSTVKMKFAFQ